MEGEQPFITQGEEHRLQGVYEHWLKYINPQSLVPTLYSSKLLSRRDKEHIDAQCVTDRKNELIWNAVISRATYAQLRHVRQILVSYNIESYGYIAQYFPNRNDDMRSDVTLSPPPPPSPQGFRQPPNYDSTLLNIKAGRTHVHSRQNSNALPQNGPYPQLNRNLVFNQSHPGWHVPDLFDQSDVDNHMRFRNSHGDVTNAQTHRISTHAHSSAERSSNQLPPGYKSDAPVDNTPPLQIDTSLTGTMSPKRTLTQHDYYTDPNNIRHYIDQNGGIDNAETALKSAHSSGTAVPKSTSVSSGSSRMSTGTSASCASPHAQKCPYVDSDVEEFMQKAYGGASDHEQRSISSATSHSSLAQSSENSLERRRNTGASMRINSDVRINLVQTKADTDGKMVLPFTLSFVDSSHSNSSTVRVRSDGSADDASDCANRSTDYPQNYEQSRHEPRYAHNDQCHGAIHRDMSLPETRNERVHFRQNSISHQVLRENVYANNNTDGHYLMAESRNNGHKGSNHREQIHSTTSEPYAQRRPAGHVPNYERQLEDASTHPAIPRQSPDPGAQDELYAPYQQYNVRARSQAPRERSRPHGQSRDNQVDITPPPYNTDHRYKHTEQHEYRRAISYPENIAHQSKASHAHYTNVSFPHHTNSPYAQTSEYKLSTPTHAPGERHQVAVARHAHVRSHSSASIYIQQQKNEQLQQVARAYGRDQYHSQTRAHRLSYQGGSHDDSQTFLKARLSESYHSSNQDSQTFVKTRQQNNSQGCFTQKPLSYPPNEHHDNTYLRAGRHGSTGDNLGNIHPNCRYEHTDPRLRGYRIDQTRTPRINRMKPSSWKSQADLRQLAPSSDDDNNTEDVIRHHVTSNSFRRSRTLSKSQPDLRKAGIRQSKKQTRGTKVFINSCLHGRRRISSLKALACCCFRLDMINIDVDL